MWQVFDIVIHILAQKISVEHVAANVVVIVFVVLTGCIVFWREDAAEYPFLLAIASAVGYIGCMVWYLSGHLSTSGPMVWILMAGTLALSIFIANKGWVIRCGGSELDLGCCGACCSCCQPQPL